MGPIRSGLPSPPRPDHRLDIDKLLPRCALAGGFLEYAKPEEIKILRQELATAGGKAKTHEVVLSVNYKAIAQGQNLQQNVALKPGDVVVVP